MASTYDWIKLLMENSKVIASMYVLLLGLSSYTGYTAYSAYTEPQAKEHKHEYAAVKHTHAVDEKHIKKYH